MTRLELINKIENRKKQINISIENLAKLSNLGVRTVNRFFAGDDVKLSTIERITNLLGLDFAGNEVVPLKELEKQRAKEKALFMASLVQSTSFPAKSRPSKFVILSIVLSLTSSPAKNLFTVLTPK